MVKRFRAYIQVENIRQRRHLIIVDYKRNLPRQTHIRTLIPSTLVTGDVSEVFTLRVEVSDVVFGLQIRFF